MLPVFLNEDKSFAAGFYISDKIILRSKKPPIWAVFLIIMNFLRPFSMGLCVYYANFDTNAPTHISGVAKL